MKYLDKNPKAKMEKGGNMTMTASEILKNIRENCVLGNFNHWNEREIKEWVKANYPCSNFVAQNVAFYLK